MEKAVEFEWDCPFQFTVEFEYSEYTRGDDYRCNLLSGDCETKRCPLIKEGAITVRWTGKGQ